MNWLNLLAGIPQAAADFFKARLEAKSKERIRSLELEDAIHSRRIDLIKQGLAADASWELEQIRASGWKDEWVLLLVSIPLIGCFIPGVAPYILTGFGILETTPEWYRWLLLIILPAVYGIRVWRRQQSDT